MPNPPISISKTTAGPAEPNSVNGILARIGGQFIAAGSAQLPTPGPGEQAEREVVLQIPDLGAVRIRYKLNSYAHRRSRHWHWLAVFAEKVSGTV